MSESETPELKPCPFCGGPAKSTKRNNGYGEVGCVLCCVWTSSSNSDEHMTVWNRRAAESWLAGEQLVELLSALEHEQWMEWARTIANTEPFLTEGRKERWAKAMVPYFMLSEEQKEHDRIWARKAIRALSAQPEPAAARVADGVAAIPSVAEVTAKAQPVAAPEKMSEQTINACIGRAETWLRIWDNQPYSAKKFSEKTEAAGVVDLLRALVDLGSHAEALQAHVKELAEQLEKAGSDLARSRYTCDQTVERMEQEIARAQAPFAVRAEQAEAKLREAEKIREAAQDVVQAWQEPNFPSRLITALDAALAAQGEKEKT